MSFTVRTYRSWFGYRVRVEESASGRVLLVSRRFKSKSEAQSVGAALARELHAVHFSDESWELKT